MKYIILSFIFIFFTVTSSSSSKGSTRHHQRFSAKTIKEKIGYMKPIHLGPTPHLNITGLLSMLKESKDKHHKLTGFDAERERKEKLLKLQFPEEYPKEQIDVFKDQKTEEKTEEKTEDVREEKKDPVGFFDDSSEEEEPVMRAGEAMEGDLQYDIDEDDLRVPI